MVKRWKLALLMCGFATVMMLFTPFSGSCEEYVDDTGVVYTTAPPQTQEVYTTEQVIYTQAPEAETTQAVVYTVAPETEPAPVVDNNTYDDGGYTFYDDGSDDNNVDYNNAEPVTEAVPEPETEATVPKYNSDRDIDDTNLSKKDWKKISKDLANASEKSDDDDSSPFNYIKNGDKATGLAGFFNSLDWMLSLGILAFVLAVVCIVIFIVFTVKKKKGYTPKSKNKHSHDDADDDEIIAPGKIRHSGDYGDGYSPQDKKLSKKKLRQDTAEIVVPNKYRK